MKYKILNYIIDNNIHLVFIYIIIGWIVYQILKHIIIKNGKRLKKKKQQTMQKLVLNIIKYLIIIAVTISVLNALGIKINSLLAGLGVASVVLSLALKDMMEDILSGISIVLEDQFDVGDYVEINGFSGTVIDLGLKNTRIKNYENTVKIMANRTITQVINYSKDNPKISVDIPIPYDINNKLADVVINNIINRIEKEVPNLTDEVKLMGLNKFKESNIDYRILISTKINEQFAVRRTINRIIKEEFDKAGISVPFNIIEVKNG